MEQPDDVPVRPANGRILVIARLVHEDFVELVPVVANRWTRTHVLVTWTVAGPGGRARDDALWLRAEDVRRSVRMPRADGP